MRFIPDNSVHLALAAQFETQVDCSVLAAAGREQSGGSIAPPTQFDAEPSALWTSSQRRRKQ